MDSETSVTEVDQPKNGEKQAPKSVVPGIILLIGLLLVVLVVPTLLFFANRQSKEVESFRAEYKQSEERTWKAFHEALANRPSSETREKLDQACSGIIKSQFYSAFCEEYLRLEKSLVADVSNCAKAIDDKPARLADARSCARNVTATAKEMTELVENFKGKLSSQDQKKFEILKELTKLRVRQGSALEQLTRDQSQENLQVYLTIGHQVDAKIEELESAK